MPNGPIMAHLRLNIVNLGISNYKEKEVTKNEFSSADLESWSQRLKLRRRQLAFTGEQKRRRHVVVAVSFHTAAIFSEPPSSRQFRKGAVYVTFFVRAISHTARAIVVEWRCRINKKARLCKKKIKKDARKKRWNKRIKYFDYIYYWYYTVEIFM